MASESSPLRLWRITCSPHVLRHTFARAYLEKRRRRVQPSAHAGHSTLDMVKRYAALADTGLAVRHQAASPAVRLTGLSR